MIKPQSLEYDVVIMGAGFAGVCQARHLMLNIPSIKVALIDPRSENRTDKDLKIGESTVEIATLFIEKELGLYEYIIENHPPKFGLNFHWPKDPAQTKNTDDYYHIYTNGQTPLASTQLNRAKFERDLLKMNKEMGVHFYNGRVVGVDLTPGDELHRVKIKIGQESLELSAKHLVDAAGRRFILGRQTDNLLLDPEDLQGIDTGSAWVRVKNIDRSIFHSGYDPDGASCSHYYATNHWFGHGHWLWMIPTETNTNEISIGVIHHREVIATESINTPEKFYNFLQANHNVLYRLLKSGEQIDFNYWPRLAHKSKQMFSADNWYVVGDAACIFDAFYSLGSSITTFGIESITEIVRAKLNRERDAEVKRKAYNEFNLTFAQCVNHLMGEHDRHLGNASLMSWRIYFENMFWFGMLVPLYVGKWHLNPRFIPIFVNNWKLSMRGLFGDVYGQLNQLADRQANIGFLHCYRADQLWGNYHPPTHFDDFLINAKYEPGQCNIFTNLKYTYLYMTIWYVQLRWKGFGWRGFFGLEPWYRMGDLLANALAVSLIDWVYRQSNRGSLHGGPVSEMRKEFQSYCYQNTLQPWQTETPAHKKIMPSHPFFTINSTL
jgi:flavin-dependent dehydrogenase